MPSELVMRKYSAGTLRSGSKSGPKVRSRAQALAIMLSERRKESEHGGDYHDDSEREAKKRLIRKGGK
jgi:hypothetical protein